MHLKVLLSKNMEHFTNTCKKFPQTWNTIKSGTHWMKQAHKILSNASRKKISLLFTHTVKSLASPEDNYYIPLVWMMRCLMTLLLRENFFPHITHSWGCSPVWLNACRDRLLCCEKFFPHISHSYGRSPVCVSKCLARECFIENFFLHMSHSWVFSSVCVITC